MPYVQPRKHELFPDNKLNRRVLVAVEVFDPIAQALVSSGVRVEARGLDGPPVLSWSGRFVWLEQSDRWPSEIVVTPVGLPFIEAHVQPPRPPAFPIASAGERLVRVVLRPTPAYRFDGVTAVRGRLSERPELGAPPMPDVRAQLAWFDLHTGGWVPAPPATAQDAATFRNGEFAVFTRVMPVAPSEPDIERGLARVRLQFTTSGAQPESRATPDDFPFLPSAQAPAGRIPEGRLLQQDLRLAWSDLRPV